ARLPHAAAAVPGADDTGGQEGDPGGGEQAMSSLAEALGAAVDAALRADAAVVAAFAPSPVRLYPLAPPTNPSFPYVLLRIDLVGDDTECGEGAEATVSADVFAR